MVQFLKAYLTVETPTAAAKVVAENSTADKINHRTVYRKGMYYLYKGTILGDRRGKHAKTMSFLNDEDIRIKVQDYLLEQKKSQRTTSKLVTFVNELLEERGGDDVRKKISIRTAQRYMHTFGYNYEHYKKGVYFDNHDREDVLDYRKEHYCPDMISHFESMGKLK